MNYKENDWVVETFVFYVEMEIGYYFFSFLLSSLFKSVFLEKEKERNVKESRGRNLKDDENLKYEIIMIISFDFF